MKTIALLLAACTLGSAAWAKLPPPSDEAKAKAAEAAAKTAHAAKVEAYQLCKAQDRVAAHYRKTAGKAGKDDKPVPTPACADPGPFVYQPATAAAPAAAPAPAPAADKKPAKKS